MSKSSEAVKRWRKNTKGKIIQGMGNECQICGYAECPDALELHHLDSNLKELSFGAVTANPQAWESKIVPELKKCILLCANCHREYHAGYAEIPCSFQRFDESKISIQFQSEMYDLCPVCGEKKAKINKYCSTRCSSKITCNAGKTYDIDDDILIEMVNNKMARKDIAKYFGCGGDVIRRRKDILGLTKKRRKKAHTLGVEPSSTE